MCCVTARGKKKGHHDATVKVFPHAIVSFTSGRGKLDARYNVLIDSEKDPVGYRASVTVSRYHLERQVLKVHVEAAAGAVDNDPSRARLWAKFHKDFRRDWAENGGRTDRVPLALALGFCVEAVRSEEHADQVLAVAVSLLGTARRDGLAALNAPGEFVLVRPEIEVVPRYDPASETWVQPRGVLADIVNTTEQLLQTEADKKLSRGTAGDTASLLQSTHRQLGKLGSALVAKHRKRMQYRRAALRAPAVPGAAASIGRTPLRTVQPPSVSTVSEVETAVKVMPKKAKAELRKRNIVLQTVEEQNKMKDDVREAAVREHLVKYKEEVENDLAYLDNKKLIGTVGTGLSRAELERVLRFPSALTWIEWECEKKQDVNEDRMEEDENSGTYVSGKTSAKDKELICKVKPAVEIMETLEKVLKRDAFKNKVENMSDLKAEFKQNGAPHGVWTALAKELSVCWENRAEDEVKGPKMPNQRGAVLRSIIEDLWQTQLSKRYSFRGPSRSIEIAVEMETREDVTITVPGIDRRKGICTLAEAATIVGGDLECPERVLQSRPCERTDIRVTNLTKKESPFYNFFSQQDVDEAAARGLACHRDGESIPDVQVGRWGKFTTPGLQARAAQETLSDRGIRLVRARHPAECAITHVSRMALNGALAKDMISPGRDGEVKTLSLRATVCCDHGDVVKRSMAVCQGVYNAGDDAESQRFFSGIERQKVQESMMSQSYPFYLSLGFAEAEDGYSHIEAPLLMVIRQLLFEKEFEIKNADGSIHFKIYIEHCGCGSFTADEKARALALSRKMGGADVFSFSSAERAGYMDYGHLHNAKVVCVEDIHAMCKDYHDTFGEQHGMQTKEQKAQFKEWLSQYPGFGGVCRQLTGEETQEELEQMFGSTKAPMGAPEMLHALAAIQAAIYAMYNTERGEYQEGLKAALDAFCGSGGNSVAFMDTLSSNKAKVVEIMIDPIKACGAFPPRSGFDEFRLLMFYGAEVYCLANLKEPTRQDELALIQNGYGFFCLTVDMVEMGFWREDEAHSVISKYFIQFGYYAGRMYGIPSKRADDPHGHRVGKVRLRDFLAQIMEKFMQSPRRYANEFSNHGASTDGMGFDEMNPLKHILLRWDAETVFNLLHGCQGSHSVGSRTNTALAQHRKRNGRHDAWLPAALLERGRAAQRFLPVLKEQLAAEKNVDGSARFVWGRDIFEYEGVGLVGMTVTEAPPEPHSGGVLRGNGSGRHPLRMRLSPLQQSLQLLLRCAWRKEKKIIIDTGNYAMTYSITKTVRHVVCNGKCVETEHHPKGHGDSVLKVDVKGFVEHYWKAEAEEFATDKSKEKWQDWGGQELKRRQALRTQVKEGGRNEGKTALSYLRAPELVEEFLWLEKLYLEPAYHSPLPCPRRTLRFPLEMSWGSGQRWPAEFADDRKVTAAVAAAMEDAGGTVQPAVEGVGNDGVAAAARMAELNGEEQVRAVRARRPTQRAQEAASLS